MNSVVTSDKMSKIFGLIPLCVLSWFRMAESADTKPPSAYDSSCVAARTRPLVSCRRRRLIQPNTVPNLNGKVSPPSVCTCLHTRITKWDSFDSYCNCDMICNIRGKSFWKHDSLNH